MTKRVLPLMILDQGLLFVLVIAFLSLSPHRSNLFFLDHLHLALFCFHSHVNCRFSYWPLKPLKHCFASSRRTQCIDAYL